MRSSVFLKTFRSDLRWVEWCFRFLKKNWQTESEFVVCAPNDCSDALKGMQELLGHKIVLAPMEQWPEKGYLHQQFMKMCADMYCEGELITYFDSDAMLVMPTDLERDLCVDGKPIIWYTEHSKIHTPWQPVVAKILSLTPKHEYMRCFPFTYHRDTLKKCREHLEKMHPFPLDTLIRNSSVGWTEFNVMGFYAEVFQKNLYSWKSTEEMFLQENKAHHWHDRVRQFHNVIDWHEGTVPYLTELYGGEVEESALDKEAQRVVKTPLKGQQELIDKIVAHIIPDTIVIDVGAHTGLHSAAYVRAGGIVHAFEPNPESFTTLWRSLYRTTGTAYAFAVSDKSGLLPMHMDKECSEASFIDSSGEGAITVPAVALDDVVPFSESETPISLIKIDVEGFEMKVLKGAKELISRNRPTIVMECQKDTLSRNGSSKEDIFAFLKDIDYSYEISTTDPRASTDENAYFFDIICTPNGERTRPDSGGDLGSEEGHSHHEVGDGDPEAGPRPVFAPSDPALRHEE